MRKKATKKIITLLILLLATAPLFSTVHLKEDNESLGDSNSRLSMKALTINGNSQLNSTASAGNGTAATPYILEGYVNESISISNTDAYFILRNCTISHQSPASIKIYLNNVTNGIITNNTYSHCFSGSGHIGIHLVDSDNNTIANSTIVYNSGNADNFRGIYLSNSDGNEILDNYICHNWQESGGDCAGIQLRGNSRFNRISKNVICNNTAFSAGSDGIIVLDSHNNEITQNWIRDNWNNYSPNNSTGVNIGDWGQPAHNNSVSWNILHNDTIPVQIWAGSTGNIVEDNDYHEFELIKNGQVTPPTGDDLTAYTYSITYTDLDDTAPTFIRVIIDGTPRNMSKQNPGDSDYTDGCLYIYTTSLAIGSHDYHFEASNGTDSERLLFIGEYSGPNVSEHVEDGRNPLIILLIIMFPIIGVTLAVVILYRQKQLSG